LGGVLLTSVFTLATTLLSHRLQTQNAERALRQEQLKQLRQERREAYVQYWSTWNRFIHALRDLSQEMRHQEMQHDPRAHLARTAPGIAERAWTAERDWREAADALLLIGGRRGGAGSPRAHRCDPGQARGGLAEELACR
jgi:hypothetical protein